MDMQTRTVVFFVRWKRRLGRFWDGLGRFVDKVWLPLVSMGLLVGMVLSNVLWIRAAMACAYVAVGVISLVTRGDEE